MVTKLSSLFEYRIVSKNHNKTIVITDISSLNMSLPTPFQKLGWPWTEQIEPNLYDNKINWPKLTIVIPSYNQGDYIEETILSIVNQNYPDLELIIIDGGSNDDTVNIIKKYESKITYWISEKDRGQAHAINKGFEKSTGEIVGWINSDDYYLSGYLYKVAKSFIKNKKTDLVYSNTLTLDERDNTLYPEFGKFLIDRFLVFGGAIYSHTAFWRKSIHQDLDEQLNCAMDFELWLRLAKGKRYRHINYFGAVFRMQVNSKSMLGDKDFKDKWDADYTYINIKHSLKTPSIWLNRMYRLSNFIYSYICKNSKRNIIHIIND